MTISNESCGNCGTAMPAGAKFCVKCGAQVSGPTQCPKCRAAVPAGSKFCVSCGTSMLEGGKVASGNRWARRAGEFASRLEMDDLSAWLKRGVAVEEGTRGLLFQHGKLAGILDPGLHTLETVAGRLKSLVVDSPCTVVLVDVGDVELSMQSQHLRTKDDQQVDATLRLVVGLNDPKDFFTNFMKGATRITTTELSEQLNQQVLSVMQGIILECKTEELYGNRELAERIQDELRTELVRSFNRFGLRFQNVEFVSFGGTAFDKLREQQGEIFVAEEKLSVQQQRGSLNQKFREAFTKERMDKVQNQSDFEDFLKQVEQEAHVKDLLRQQEREELWRQYEEKKEDHELAREHLLATLQWQQKREQLAGEMAYKRELLHNRQELDDAQREHELQVLEQQQRAEIDRVNRDHEAELQRLERKRQSDLAHQTAQIDQEFAQTQKEADLAMKLQSQLNEMKHQTAEREIDRDLARQRGEQEIRQVEADAEHQREVDRLNTLSSMSVEALIASSPSDQAKLLAELKATDTLKGMTEEQILARAAENSPEVARAFAEKFRAAGSQEASQQMKEMYERMHQQQEKSTEQLTASHQESMKTFKELAQTALQTQRDTAVASAQGPQVQGPAIVYPPPGSGAATVVGSQQPVQSSAGPPMLDCPQCREQSPTGSQFCGNCGFRFA